MSIKSDIVNTAEGKVSEMHCTVYAEPPASLVWLKEDRVLKANNHISLYQDPNKIHKHILKIENTKAEDFGTYHCVANNTLGATRKTIVLSGKSEGESACLLVDCQTDGLSLATSREPHSHGEVDVQLTRVDVMCLECK